MRDLDLDGTGSERTFNLSQALGRVLLVYITLDKSSDRMFYVNISVSFCIFT